MLSRTKILSSLLDSREARESYLRAKLNQLIPSQIRALRLREEWSQKKLGEEADMKQARISATETPGVVNFSLETLVRLAAAFRVGLQVRFVPYSRMRDWEIAYSQDSFSPVPIEQDRAFLSPHLPAAQDEIGFLAPECSVQARQGSEAGQASDYGYIGLISGNTASAGGSTWMNQ